MKKIMINDNDYCKGCKLVNKYNELIDINNEHQNINGKLREENKEQDEYIKYWQEQYDKKQEIIDKAIEYINHAQTFGKSIRIPYVNGIDLLDILKGEDNE